MPTCSVIICEFKVLIGPLHRSIVIVLSLGLIIVQIVQVVKHQGLFRRSPLSLLLPIKEPIHVRAHGSRRTLQPRYLIQFRRRILSRRATAAPTRRSLASSCLCTRRRISFAPEGIRLGARLDWLCWILTQKYITAINNSKKNYYYYYYYY